MSAKQPVAGDIHTLARGVPRDLAVYRRDSQTPTGSVRATGCWTGALAGLTIQARLEGSAR